MNQTRLYERRMGRWLRRRVPPALAEFILFTAKQAWACLFGASLLAAIIGTKLFWQSDWPLARYDALFLFALALQAIFLRFNLETWAEARAILIFHLTGTAMEWFKVSAGSWAYPEAAFFKIYGVPLFSGFMYASVGSYMARVIRLFDMQFAPFPPMAVHFGLAICVYVNFFAHHFIWDARYILFAATLVFYVRTRIWFRIGQSWYWMPLPVAAGFSSIFLWLAENIGTLTGTWIYSGQSLTDLVSVAKLGSWYLLLYVAFATVTLVDRSPVRYSPVSPTRKPPALRSRSARLRSRPAGSTPG